MGPCTGGYDLGSARYTVQLVQDASLLLRPVFQLFVPMLKHGPCMANVGVIWYWANS